MTVASPFAESVDLTLTDAEREEVLELAQSLVCSPPAAVDGGEWISQVRRISCRLPLRVREAVRDFRTDSGVDGSLLLRNLPLDEMQLPDTPAVPESVERTAAVPAAVVSLVSLQLGEVVAYEKEKSGALIQNVVPVPGREGSQSNAGSELLELHGENVFHPHRPDFVALFCLRTDHTASVGTPVSSIRRALAHLPEEAREVLLQPRFVTQPPASFHAGAETAPHPLLEGDGADPNVRVDFCATVPLDDEAKAAMEKLHEAFLEVPGTVVLQPGELVFVDNRLAVHGRTQFMPRYDGRDRWLHRMFVQLDSRRSRGHRPGGGSVLV